ncbi:MAG: potassium channel family protein [Candidatus Sumerlaeota bacterium]|nr:potassium channel family protein [Candidatus Sumerlaeota bacterium]
MSGLSEDERNALAKPLAMLGYSTDHRLLMSALEKLAVGSDKKAIADCSHRLAIACERSRIPHAEKASMWKTAADAAMGANEPSARALANAADHLGRDSAHLPAAQLYERAARLGMVEGLSSTQILGFLRESRRFYEFSGNADLAGRVFLQESDYKLQTSHGISKLWMYFFKHICAYGESTARVALTACAAILVCAVFYWVVGVRSAQHDEIVHSLPISLYFSVVTFTTLGYGDYSPAGLLSMAVCALEAICGLFLASLFLVTVVRKYAR